MTIQERIAFVESRKAERAQQAVAQHTNEVTKKLEKLNELVAKRNESIETQSFYQRRIDTQLVWFQDNDVSVEYNGTQYVLVAE